MLISLFLFHGSLFVFVCVDLPDIPILSIMSANRRLSISRSSLDSDSDERQPLDTPEYHHSGQQAPQRGQEEFYYDEPPPSYRYESYSNVATPASQASHGPGPAVAAAAGAAVAAPTLVAAQRRPGTGAVPLTSPPSLPPSSVTPGVDNFGEYAAGGMAGIAYSVAAQHARESAGSWTSLQELNTAALPPGSATPGSQRLSRSTHSVATEVYTDDPYQGYSARDGRLGVVNPSEIADDGDDGLEYGPRGNGNGARVSILSMAGQSLSSSRSANKAGAVPPVTAAAYTQKSEWLARQSSSAKRWRWVMIIGACVAIVAGIVCGVVFGVVLKQKKSSDDAGSSSSSKDSDLGINSIAIQKLMNNEDLHKVFPGIDYTPLNSQYPGCLASPPSQDNVTQDVAVLSQLTNTIRLYGTDCNQTEMTLEAIKRLELEDTVKIWMGVWQDGNATTNARQLAQMWDILDANGPSPFVGVIVANEILYREEMTVTELGNLLAEVRSNLTARGMESLPVATSDLGTVWDASLAAASDYVMANIHPFFGGVNATAAAAWTETFWETNVGAAFKSNTSRNVISETGWPTQGGTDCGTGSTETSCPDAAVAGISELNAFMADWVCSALANGTQYFWFEAFDEPWKIKYNTDTEAWEDHWGLMDVNRNLKKGVTIPDCGGQTVG